MASISSVQSSSSAYDVFLSFHGEDTRNNNNNSTGFLFQALRRKGIVAFKGHTLPEKGEPELLHAIEGSRLFIVVLSKNYASSTRCLRELAHIFNCIETSPRRLLPIFYDVDPSDVREQTGWYEEAFWKHEQRFLVDKERMEEVRTWRKALTRVANLPGWYIPNKPQYTEIEEFVQYIITILGPNISTLQNEAEGTSSDKDEVLYNELSGLMRIRDFISLVLTYPGKLEDENILRSWISAFPEWKAQLLSTGDDTVMDKPWCVLTDKALGPMKGFMPMEIISKVESGERSIFSHNDVDAIPEAILQQSVDLAVNQLLQTLFSGDYCARYIRLLTRNLAEKGSVVDTIVSAVEDKHTMFGIDKDFLRALWINASTYETDAEVRVQEQIDINMMMEVDDMGSNGQLVIVVDADSNNKLDLQKLRFPTGIVVLITTEPSTQAEKDVDFRIACTMDLNIWTQDHLLPWKVFCSYVGSCISSSMVSSSMAIQKIAEEIVKECHGHLLAIVLVAKYLTYVQDFKQWELALDKLSSLNPSYDYQDSDRIGISRVMVNAFVNIIWEDIDDAQKLCLELSLPVHNIKNGVRDDILVSDWAKIISGYTQELGEYRRQLQHYINELQDRFVLLKYESGDVYLPVETYDIIKSLHTSKPSILRHGALGLTEPPYIGRWHSLVQIELMDNKICELPQSPDCPKLKVLLLQGNVDLMDIPDSFFNHMPLLQHLDLSYTSIRDLPPSVSKLIQLQKFYLRGCDLFMELPHQIGQLKNLKELDLDGTLITHLPIEIRELINLQSLSLCFDGTSRSTIIPPGLVSNLTQLNYLSINVDPEDERWNENVISVLREIFFGLWNLQRLSIYVPKADLLEFIPTQKSLNFRLVVGQHMRRLISRVPPELETKFKHCDYSIKFVNGVNVPNGVKMHLGRFKALYLDRHMTIKSLSDFDLRNLWGLEVCILAECNEMETIVSGSNSPDRPASLMLKFLSVFYMKNLRSVCEGSSPFFLCLKSIALHTCPMLTTIFTLDSLKKLSFLEEIIIEDCPKVTTLISHATPEQKPVFFLPKLRMISLLYLPELVNIFNGIHVGPFIEEMIFYYCPSLQSLSKSELSSKSLKIIKGESIWWEALKWNVAEWGDAGRPNYFDRIFSPINEEADMMNQLAALQETRLNEHHNTTYQGISSSTHSIAKSSLEIPVLSPLAPVSSVGRGSSNSEAQKRKVVTEPKILQDASKKIIKQVREQRTVQTEVWTEPEVWTEKISVNAEGYLNDGYSWRKYGQKSPLGAKFPRGYYKCAYGSVQGCPARKQVQRLDENPATFEITYQGRHTCTKEQNLIIKSGDEGISSSTQSIAKSSLEIPVLSPSAPVSSVGRGSSNIEAQKRKVVTEPKIFQDASEKCNLIMKKGILGLGLKLSVPVSDQSNFAKFLDGVRIVSQNDVEAPPQIKPTDNQLTLADIDVIKVVGEGNGGVVQLVQHKWTRQFFVLKVIQMNIEESMRKQIAQELKITQQAQCPYVVVCYQSFYENGVISILLEYMDGGSLADLLKKVKTIPEDYLAAICKQVLKGLVYLHHEKHIIHRDLKPSNLLINHIGEVKITDFGVSAIMESTSGQANTFIGTYNYMSPERINGSQRGYNFKSDIWSLGLILLECALGRFPYAPPDQSETWESIFELIETIVDKPPPSPPSEQFSTEFCSFISACLQKDPKDRLSAQELMAHPFVNMYDDLEVDLSAYFSSAGSPLATL